MQTIDAILEQSPGDETRAALSECLLAGGWWAHCRTLLRPGADTAAWLDGLPTPDLPADGLERWCQAGPLADWLDPPPTGAETLRHPLPSLAAQLHCARLALALPKGATAADWPTRSPADPFEDVDQEKTVRALAAHLRRPATELRYWVLDLLRGEAGVQQQRIDGLWVVEERAAGVMELILSLVPGLPATEPDSLVTHPASALVTVDPIVDPRKDRATFEPALHAGWQAARATLEREEHPWPADAGLAWRVVGRGAWRFADTGPHWSAAPPPSLSGPSAGGAVALAAYLLGRRATWETRREQGYRWFHEDLLAPLLDPDATKGVAVSAEIRDAARGAFHPIGGLRDKLKAAGRLKVHTVIDSGTQPIADLEGLRVLNPEQSHAFVSQVADPDTGHSITVLRAQDLPQAVFRLDGHLRSRWGKAQLFGGRIARFLEEYLGTPTKPVPFGGRGEAMGELDAWLADPVQRCLLLAAPAGRGKSALLAQWVTQLWLRPNIALVFLPISIRFETNLRRTIADILLTRLAALHGEPLTWGDKDAPLDVCLERIQGYLRRPLADGRTLLLVLDGLDEAADWLPEPAFFPADPPAGVRLLIAARYLVRDGGSPRGWLDRLGWATETTRVPDLNPLDHAGLTDTLGRMELPPDGFAEPERLMARLLELTEGDPLLVRFYVEDLWERGSPAAFSIDHLAGVAPGLKGYYRLWWSKQVRHSDPLWQDKVHALLAVLATALGPIDAADLTRLAGVPMDTDVLAAVRRWVVGDGQDQGLVFSHSRLGNFYREEEMAPTECEGVEGRFLEWGATTLTRLNTWVATRISMENIDLNAASMKEKWLGMGDWWLRWIKHWKAVAQDNPSLPGAEPLLPEYTPQYLRKNYGAHLERRHNAEPTTKTLKDLLDLLTEGWLRACEGQNADSSSFLVDVDRVFLAARKDDQRAASRSEWLSWIGTQVRCALYQASIHEVATRIPVKLPGALLRAGIWTPTMALSQIARICHPPHRANSLIAFLHEIPKNIDRLIVSKSIAMANDFADGYLRPLALAALAPHVNAPQEIRLTVAILASASDLSRESAAGEILAREIILSITRHLSQNMPEWLVYDVADAARGLNDPLALANLSEHVPTHLRDTLLSEALELATRTNHLGALIALVSKISSPSKESTIASATSTAWSLSDTYERTRSLSILASFFPDQHAAKIRTRAAQSAMSIQDAGDQVLAMLAIADQVPDQVQRTLLDNCLTVARKIEPQIYRAEILTEVGLRLADSSQCEILNEALTESKTIGDVEWQTRALGTLVPRIPAGMQAAVQMAVRSGYERMLSSDSSLRERTGIRQNLPPESVLDVFSGYRNMGGYDQSFRATAIATEGMGLSDMDRLSLALDELDKLRLEERAALFAGIEEWATTMLLPLARPETAGEMAQAIMDVSRWWP